MFLKNNAFIYSEDQKPYFFPENQPSPSGAVCGGTTGSVPGGCCNKSVLQAGAATSVLQCKVPAAGVIPLPLCLPASAFKAPFCNFCLGSNEAWQCWLVHDNNPTLVSFESFLARFIKEEWLFQSDSKHVSFYKTLWLTAWNNKVWCYFFFFFFEL